MGVCRDAAAAADVATCPPSTCDVRNAGLATEGEGGIAGTAADIATRPPPTCDERNAVLATEGGGGIAGA